MHQANAMLSDKTHWGNREAIREGSYGRVLYNYFRYYGPSIGRYINADPIGQLFDYRAPEIQLAIGAGVLRDPVPADGDLNHLYNYAALNPLLAFDPSGLGQTTNLGGGTTVRIERPKHGGPGQTHAHVKTPKGNVVVNQNGTVSHTGRGSLNNLNNKAKNFLRSRGFRIPGALNLPMLLPEPGSPLWCTFFPNDPACSGDPDC